MLEEEGRKGEETGKTKAPRVSRRAKAREEEGKEKEMESEGGRGIIKARAPREGLGVQAGNMAATDE